MSEAKRMPKRITATRRLPHDLSGRWQADELVRLDGSEDADVEAVYVPEADRDRLAAENAALRDALRECSDSAPPMGDGTLSVNVPRLVRALDHARTLLGDET